MEHPIQSFVRQYSDAFASWTVTEANAVAAVAAVHRAMDWDPAIWEWAARIRREVAEGSPVKVFVAWVHGLQGDDREVGMKILHWIIRYLCNKSMHNDPGGPVLDPQEILALKKTHGPSTPVLRMMANALVEHFVPEAK